MLLDYNALLNEAIDDILLEKLSISDDVVSMASYYTNTICEKYKSEEYVSRETKYVNYVRNEFATMIIRTIDFHADFISNDCFSLLKRVVVEIYEFSSNKEMNELSGRFKVTAVSILSNGTLLLKVPSIGGVLDVIKLKTMLTHEFEHYFQYGKSNGNLGDLSLYDVANAVLDSETSSKEEKSVAMAIYRFNKKEIDAKVHELSVELKVNKVSSQEGLNNCRVMKEMNDTIEKVYNVFSSGNKKVIDNILSIYGINKEKMSSYLRDGIKYFREKVGKVYQRHIDSLNNGFKDVEIYR